MMIMDTPLNDLLPDTAPTQVQVYFIFFLNFISSLDKTHAYHHLAKVISQIALRVNWKGQT